MTNVMDEINAVRKRNREDYEELAKMTGKTITEIEADTTAPDPSENHLHKLSDSLSIEQDDLGGIVLYDTRGHSPQHIATITAGEMSDLRAFYDDGLCPICLKEIALYDIICDECLEDARNTRRLARPR